jgi:hypothetical protein
MRIFYTLILSVSSVFLGVAQSASVPKEFQKESVVILELLNEYSFSVDGAKSIIIEKKFSRVYLSDKNAVNTYSTFYTSKSSDNDVFVLNIIKPDNSKKIFSYADGIEEKEQVSIPLYFRSNISLGSTYYKFALPDLEPGDVLEYTTINRHSYYGTVAPFTRVYMNGDFPIVVNKLSIDVDNKFYIYHHSVLGAPGLKKENRVSSTVYTLQDTLLSKIGYDWKLPREVYIPHIKFVVSNSSNSVRYVIPPLDPTKKEMGPITDTEVKKLFAEFKNQTNLLKYSKKIAAVVVAKVRSSNPSLNPKTDYDQLIEKCWYYIRYKVVNDEALSDYESYIQADGDTYFVMVMYHIIASMKQSADIYICSDNKSLPLTDAISPREINWGIRYKDKYMMIPTYYMQYGELSNSFQGQKGYVIKNYSPKTKPEEIQITSIQLPARDYKENYLGEKVKVTLDLNDEPKITCERDLLTKKGFTGIFIPSYYNVFFNLNQLDYLKMNPIDSSTMYQGYTKSYAQEKRQKDKEALEKYYKQLHERYEEELKNSYDNVDEYISWKIVDYGLTPGSNVFNIQEKFTMEDMVTKVGNGYIIKLGLMLGNYTRFIEEERIRNYGGMLDLSSSKLIEITFIIPEGYKLSSTDEFNKSYTCNYVDIKSSIKTEGNVVTITLTRDFKKQAFTKEEYQDVLKFYDMMYELSQSKIVIKK